MSTLQMFTMLHVCKIRFHMPSLTSTGVFSVLVLSFLFTRIYFLYSWLWFFILLKTTHLILWLDLTLPTVWMSDKHTSNMTHKHEHGGKKIHAGNSNYIKNVKKIYWIKIVQWKYCTKQIKLCCDPSMHMFLLWFTLHGLRTFGLENRNPFVFRYHVNYKLFWTVKIPSISIKTNTNDLKRISCLDFKGICWIY